MNIVFWFFFFNQNQWLRLVGIWYLSAQKLRVGNKPKAADHCNWRPEDWVQAFSGFLFLQNEKKRKKRLNFSTFLWNTKSSLRAYRKTLALFSPKVAQGEKPWVSPALTQWASA